MSYMWATVVALGYCILVASCLNTKTREREEITALPGAAIYAEGKSSATGMYREAIQLLEESRFEEAEILYRELIELEPENPQGYIGLGSSLLYQNRLEGAERAYLHALDLRPRSIGAMIGLGSVHYLDGKYEEADKYYRSVLEIEEDAVNAHWGRALVLEQQGEKEASVYHFRRFLELAPNSNLADDAALRIEALRDRDVKQE